MTKHSNITKLIVETLYHEALDLAEEARVILGFFQKRVSDEAGADQNAVSVALSREAIKTTTMMMHATAWLLNQRAFFAGELSEVQLQRMGRLPPAQEPGTAEELALLPFEVNEMVLEVREFFHRVARMDRERRAFSTTRSTPVHALQARLHGALARA